MGNRKNGSNFRILVFPLTKEYVMEKEEDSKIGSNLHTSTFLSQHVSPSVLCCSLNISNANITSQLPRALISSMDWLRDRLTVIEVLSMETSMLSSKKLIYKQTL